METYSFSPIMQMQQRCLRFFVVFINRLRSRNQEQEQRKHKIEEYSENGTLNIAELRSPYGVSDAVAAKPLLK